MASPRKARIAALAFLTGIALAAITHSLWRVITGPAGAPPPEAPASTVAMNPSASQAAPVPSARVGSGSGLAAPSPAAGSREAGAVPPARREVSWARFKDRFGSELQARFEADGTLSMVTGAPGEGARAGTDFRTDDPQKAIARAREILEAARDLLGVQPDAPLESPIARPGPVSAQVFFRESKAGAPVEPYGGVKVDLGPQGELLGISSDYVRNIGVANAPGLDPEEARAKASAAIVGAGGSRVEGGAHVLWVQRESADQAFGRHAYVYVVQGREVVVDASNGAILSRRDRRTD